MSGNVWEWVADCRLSDVGVPGDGGASERRACDRRVARGGSWRDEPSDFRWLFYNLVDTRLSGNDAGFRVARALSP